MKHLLPHGWPRPKGYSNGISVKSGRTIYLAGLIGWNEKEIIESNGTNEYLFGDDNSEDKTNDEIDKLSKKLNNNKIIKYNGPGICKSENVYKGIENSNGDIIVIYDADLTVSFKDVEFSINILKNTNADFINCTRMIYPQKDGAMKLFNFIGNSFFASLFSLLLSKEFLSNREDEGLPPGISTMREFKITVRKPTKS